MTLDILFENYPRKREIFASSSHTEAFRDPEISNIYKALDSVVKATYYFRNNDELEKSKSKVDKEDDNELLKDIDFKKPSKVHVFIPVIIVEGTLVKAYLDDNSSLQIEEGSYIPYESYYIDNSGIEHSYSVEVMHLEYLKTYLQQVEEWLEQKGKQLLNSRPYN